RFVALLRAVNANRRVKMTVIGDAFVSLRLSAVTTVMASGNVLFETPSTNIERLERTVAKRLRIWVGWDVAVFVRTGAELSRIIAARPHDTFASLSVVFFAKPLDRTARQQVLALNSATDRFQLRRREIYWLRKKRQGRAYTTVPLDKALQQPFTIRGISTVRKLMHMFVNNEP